MWSNINNKYRNKKFYRALLTHYNYSKAKRSVSSILTRAMDYGAIVPKATEGKQILSSITLGEFCLLTWQLEVILRIII
jgi:hypothetical protein